MAHVSSDRLVQTKLAFPGLDLRAVPSESLARDHTAGMIVQSIVFALIVEL